MNHFVDTCRDMNQVLHIVASPNNPRFFLRGDYNKLNIYLHLYDTKL